MKSGILSNSLIVIASGFLLLILTSCINNVTNISIADIPNSNIAYKLSWSMPKVTNFDMICVEISNLFTRSVEVIETNNRTTNLIVVPKDRSINTLMPNKTVYVFKIYTKISGSNKSLAYSENIKIYYNYNIINVNVRSRLNKLILSYDDIENTGSSFETTERNIATINKETNKFGSKYLPNLKDLVVVYYKTEDSTKKYTNTYAITIKEITLNGLDNMKDYTIVLFTKDKSGLLSSGIVKHGTAKAAASDLVKLSSYNIAEINHAWGVKVYLSFNIQSQYKVKYITFSLIAYDSVDEPIKDDINGKIKSYLQADGPYNDGQWGDGYWDSGYFPGIKYIKVDVDNVELFNGSIINNS